MKNDIPGQMFHTEDYLLNLIVKRIAPKLLLSVTCVALIAPLVGLPAFAQMSVNDARNLREHIYKGNSLMARRDFEGALNEYEQALEIEPGNGTAKDNIVLTHNNWGIDLFRQKKYDDAREQWNMALKLNPYDRNAKNNLAVLKATLIKLGPAATPAPQQSGDTEKDQASADAEPKSGPSVMPKGSRAAKEDNTPVPNAVVIGHPSSGGSSSGGSDSFSSGAAVTTGGSGGSGGNSSGGVVILNSASRQIAPPQPPPVAATPAAPQAPPAPPMNPYAGTTSQAPPLSEPTKPGQATNIYSSSSSGSNSLGLANLEDKLSALETKIYGHPTKDTPILQRLERIERDTTSRASLGSINDRVQTLLKTYGL